MHILENPRRQTACLFIIKLIYIRKTYELKFCLNLKRNREPETMQIWERL